MTGMLWTKHEGTLYEGATGGGGLTEMKGTTEAGCENLDEVEGTRTSKI